MIGLLGGFIAGIIVGLMWREAFELARGKDDPVALLSRLRRAKTRAVHRLWDVTTPTLAKGLVASMAFTGCVGIALLVSNGARGDLVRCVSEYNALAGAARDSRIIGADEVAESELTYLREELRYQRRLHRVLENGEDISRLIEVIDERERATQQYIDEKVALQGLRENKPYPAPNLCEGE